MVDADTFLIPFIKAMNASSISMRWCHPRACRRVTSVSLRRVPSGLERSHCSSPRKPTSRIIISAASRMLISLPVPMLMWQLRISSPFPAQISLKSTFSSTWTLASAISSLHRNSRIGVPVPQRVTASGVIPNLASFSRITCSVQLPFTPSTGLRSISFLTASQLPSFRHLAR